MNRYCVDKWDKNKEVLKQKIATSKGHHFWGYKNLVEMIIKYVLNDSENSHELWDETEIIEVDHGDYQGTLLFLFHRRGYQPSSGDYMITEVGYGSCSVCDTLQSIQWNDYNYEDPEAEPTEQQVEDYMALCLHLIQQMRCPYWNSSYWIEKENLKEI